MQFLTSHILCFKELLNSKCESYAFKTKCLGLHKNIKCAFSESQPLQKAWKALHFIMHILKKGKNNMKHLASTALLRPILEYGAVCWDPYGEGQVSTLDQVQKRAAKFPNNINESGWETLAQRRLIA